MCSPCQLAGFWFFKPLTILQRQVLIAWADAGSMVLIFCNAFSLAFLLPAFLSPSLFPSYPVLFSIPTISFLVSVLQNGLDTIHNMCFCYRSTEWKVLWLLFAQPLVNAQQRGGLAGSEVEVMLSVIVFNTNIYFSRCKSSLKQNPSRWFYWGQFRKNHSAVRFRGWKLHP